MMSLRLTAGSCLEGTLTIPIDSNPKPLLGNRPREEVDLAADEFAKPPFQCTEFEQPDASLRIELGKQIDVAVCAGLATSYGTE